MNPTAQGRAAWTPDLGDALRVIQRRHRVRGQRALLVGVSGIDGSGKGFVGQRLEQQLTAQGWKVAFIGTDPLQNPLTIRLAETGPARHFYDHVFRWREIFDDVVDPLVASRRLDIVVNAIQPDVDDYYPLRYRFDDVDIVLLEGILLFKRQLARRFDVKLWVDCTFATALARAHARNQENLPREVIDRDYERVYHAAQRLHFELDEPRSSADVIVVNDPLLAAGTPEPRDERHREGRA